MAIAGSPPSSGRSGLLLVIFGAFLLGQTLIGGLVDRLLSLRSSSTSSTSSPPPPTDPSAAAINQAGDAGSVAAAAALGGVGAGPPSASADAGNVGAAAAASALGAVGVAPTITWPWAAPGSTRRLTPT